VLFTFPSRYLFTIGQYEYLALDLSRPDFRPDFSCLVVLKKKSGNCMVFRDTGLSPSLVRRSRRVLLNSKHNSLPLYRAAMTSTYNAILATTVIFKFLSCDSNNTKMVWANRYLFAGRYYILIQRINFYIFPLSLATTDGISLRIATQLIYFPHATEMFHFAWFPHSYPHG
jgi:hypothetical protein